MIGCMVLALTLSVPFPSEASARWDHAAPPPADRSALALACLADSREPELLLAQRAIEREWTVPEDSVVRTPGADAELRALVLSAAVPGTGQLVEGEPRGLWFLVAEAAGWAGWWLFHRDADRLRDDATAMVGAPGDSASTWSFERWADATGEDPSSLETLYAADHEAFYDAIASESRLLPGWADATSREQFDDLRLRSNQKLGRARGVEVGLWVNHLLAAADGLRAARNRHLALGRGFELKANARLRQGRPEMRLAVQRSFR
ncbi:MAG TPA: hypothetical protein VGK93_07620 [Candidatus Eisenbacteria bacterium]|jgi:hypothetical protein